MSSSSSISSTKPNQTQPNPQTDNSPAIYTWKVEHFAHRTDNYYWSKPFSPPHNSAIQFELYLYPKRERILWNDDGTVIALYLASRGTDDDEHQMLTVKYCISIVDASGVKCNTSESTTKFSSRKAIHNGQYTISRGYLLDPDNELLVDGSLTIYCEVHIVENEDANSSQTNSSSNTKQVIHDYTVLEDYQSLLEEGKFADAILLVGSGENCKEFPVHKAILVARSAVFAAMFEHTENKEAQENRVEIIDVPVDVFGQLLRFIYTGTVTDLDQYALELMEAADKYQLNNLKCICEQYLCTNLTTESVANILLVADMHQATDLKTKCIEYIIEQGSEVMATEGWTKLTTARPELGFELFQFLLTKQQTNSVNDICEKVKAN